MKKRLIALALSIILAAGSLGAVPVFAAETTAETTADEAVPAAEEDAEEQPEEAEAADTGVSDSDASEAESSENMEDAAEEPGQELAESLEESESPDEQKAAEVSRQDEEEAAEKELREDDPQETEASILEDVIADGEENEAEGAAALGTCGTDLTWEFVDGAMTISGTGEMFDFDQNDGETSPWYNYRDQITTVTIENGVTSIGEGAFNDCTNLTAVTIPDSVTSIGNYAFSACWSLQSVEIPDSVTRIGEGAFLNCSSLKRVEIPYGVASIEYGTFWSCSDLTSVTIPDSVTSIGENAFLHCASLTSVTIPYGVRNIGNSAFESCTSLTGVRIPDSVTSMGEGVFNNCQRLTSVAIPDSLTRISGGCFSSCTSLTSVTIPDSVTSIGDGAFYYCLDLMNVTIPDSVTSIGENAFYNCSSLTRVTIPYSVTRIGDYAFSDCRKLNSISVSKDNEHYCDIDGVLFNKEKTELIQYPSGREGDYEVPEGVETVKFFGDSRELTSIIIPEGVKRIVDFRYCTKLESIIIPESVSYIGTYGFQYCSSLKTVYFEGDAPEFGLQYDYNHPDGTGVAFERDSLTAYYPANNATWTDEVRNDYGGTITWVEKAIELSDCAVTVSPGPYIYDGTAKEPDVAISYKNKALTDSKDYSVSYSDNTNAGTAAVTVTGIGKYTGTITETFTIGKAEPVLTFAEASVSKTTADSAFTNELTKTTDGTVTFSSDNTAVAEVDSSTGQVTVKGAGTATITAAAAEGTNYTAGSASYTLTVTEAGAGLSLEDLTYSFANSAFSFGYPKDYVIPLSSYEAIFGKTTKAAWYYKIQSTWGGSCMGFSSTAALLYDPDNGLFPSGFNPGAGRISDLNVQDENSSIGMNVTQFIEAMQISQKTQRVKDTISSNRVYTSEIRSGDEDLSGLYSSVREQTEAKKPVIIAVYQNGGHAILAYKAEDVSETESRIYVYDNNFPSSERYITLNKDDSGNYTSWSYNMGGYYGTWGTSNSSSSISYIPYSVIEFVWANRGDVSEIQNVVRFNSRNIALFDGNNKLAATVVDGQILTSNSRIRLIEDDLEAGGSSDDGYTLLSIPVDVYTVKNLDSNTESLDLAIVDTDLGASVDTTAKEVTFVVDDSNDLNSILIKAEEDDRYSIVLNSSFDHDDHNEVEINGYGMGETLEVSREAGYININNCQILNITVDGVDVKKYTVSASSGEGGSISPSGESAVIRDMDTAYTITPDSGYVIEDVKVDGMSVGAITSYTFKQVRADHTISASFKKSVTLPGKTTRGDMFNLANNVKVTWKAVQGAKYYKVYREGVTDPAETRKDPVIVTAGLVGWDKDPGLTNGHAYRYKIVASLTGKGDSSGDSKLSYSKVMYRLKTVVIRSVKNTAPGKVTVKYDKTTSGDSYVLQYCERQDMVGAKTKVVLGASNTSYVIGGLKKGKTYYISIRVRKKVNGIDYYTTFGVPKKVTVIK